MTSNHRKARGMSTQRIAADALRGLYPYATARGAGEAGADLMHTPGLAVEVKATSRGDLLAAIRQAQSNAQPGELPVVIHRPNGYGPARVHEWVVAMSLGDFIDHLAGGSA
jgi:hypothetical protein